MSDPNRIRISFDQQTAVRILDGLRLTAVPVMSERETVRRCAGCRAHYAEWSTSCPVSWADNPGDRCCNAVARKDRRNIVWKERI